MLAKTDAMDARMLALYGAVLDLPATAPVAPERLKLQSLNSRRDQLVAMRKAERIRLNGVTDPVVIDSLKAVIALFDGQIRALERRIQDTVAKACDLARDAALLRSAAGVGPVCAAVILASLPELGRIDRRAVAARLVPRIYRRRKSGVVRISPSSADPRDKPEDDGRRGRRPSHHLPILRCDPKSVEGEPGRTHLITLPPAREIAADSRRRRASFRENPRPPARVRRR